MRNGPDRITPVAATPVPLVSPIISNGSGNDALSSDDYPRETTPAKTRRLKNYGEIGCATGGEGGGVGGGPVRCRSSFGKLCRRYSTNSASLSRIVAISALNCSVPFKSIVCRRRSNTDSGRRRDGAAGRRGRERAGRGVAGWFGPRLFAS